MLSPAFQSAIALAWLETQPKGRFNPNIQQYFNDEYHIKKYSGGMHYPESNSQLH